MQQILRQRQKCVIHQNSVLKRNDFFLNKELFQNTKESREYAVCVSNLKPKLCQRFD